VAHGVHGTFCTPHLFSGVDTAAGLAVISGKIIYRDINRGKMKFILHKKLHEYRAIILDMDGTLYYHFPLKICMAFELLCYYALHIRRFRDLITLILFRKSRESGVLNAGNAIVDYWMHEKPLAYIHLFRDKKLLALTREFRHRGAKIVVYSDYPAVKKIEALHPFQADFVFHAADAAIQCLKPNVKGLQHILSVIKEPSADTVFIGDRYEKDGKCAKALGMDYVILHGDPLRRNLFYRSVSNGYY
jgi:HAD superfamily hydrolase (TIGR01549 family)